MPFTKGYSGNISGRPLGSQNIKTAEIQSIIRSVINSSFEKTKIEKDLKELSPRQRLDYLLRLVEFVLPRPKPAELQESNAETKRAFYNRVMPYLKETALNQILEENSG